MALLGDCVSQKEKSRRQDFHLAREHTRVPRPADLRDQVLRARRGRACSCRVCSRPPRRTTTRFRAPELRVVLSRPQVIILFLANFRELNLYFLDEVLEVQLLTKVLEKVEKLILEQRLLI